MEAGLVGEFATADDLLIALQKLRERGYVSLDACTPYPIHGLDQVLQLKRSLLPWAVFPFGLGGATFAFTVQWWCNAVSYNLNVGGRPSFAIPAFIPITFETTVLFSALSGLLILFYILRLPRLAHPLFEVEGFERATIDRFFAVIHRVDPRFDSLRSAQDLAEVGALRTSSFGRAP
jgi:hypothetical protein